MHHAIGSKSLAAPVTEATRYTRLGQELARQRIPSEKMGHKTKHLGKRHASSLRSHIPPSTIPRGKAQARRLLKSGQTYSTRRAQCAIICMYYVSMYMYVKKNKNSGDAWGGFLVTLSCDEFAWTLPCWCLSAESLRTPHSPFNSFYRHSP